MAVNDRVSRNRDEHDRSSRRPRRPRPVSARTSASAGRVVVIVHVTLSLVLLLRILVWLVVVLHGEVVVLMSVCRAEVLPRCPVPLVVDRMGVRVRVDHGSMPRASS